MALSGIQFSLVLFTYTFFVLSHNLIHVIADVLHLLWTAARQNGPAAL